MKQNVSKHILTYLFPVLIFLYPAYVLSETQQGSSNKITAAGQIEISSNMLEVDNKANIVVFTGDVSADRDDFTIDCQKMFLHYKKGEDKADSQDTNNGIEKIIATGEVKISRSDGSLATADKAVYYQDIDQLVLTGNPVIKQGNNFIEGSSITLFINEDRSIVENAKAVLYSKTEEDTPIDR